MTNGKGLRLAEDRCVLHRRDKTVCDENEEDDGHGNANDDDVDREGNGDGDDCDNGGCGDYEGEIHGNNG